MNNAEWMKLLKKQRERESVKVEEVKDNASIIDNGNGNNNGSDAGNGAGGEDSNPFATSRARRYWRRSRDGIS